LALDKTVTAVTNTPVLCICKGFVADVICGD